MSEARSRFSLVQGFVVVLAAVGVGVAIYYFGGTTPRLPDVEPPPAEPLSLKQEAAKAALKEGNLDLALELVNALLARDASDSASRLLAGELASRLGNPAAALAHYAEIPDDGSLEGTRARWAAGNIQLFQGQLRAAEANFRAVLKRDPQHQISNERLAFLLTIEGRRWEAQALLQQLLRNQRFDAEQLMLFANPEETVEDPGLLQVALQAQPDDVLPRLAAARVDFKSRKHDSARQALEIIVERYPEVADAQAMLGQIYFLSGDYERLTAWDRQLPPGASAHPEVWMVRGMYADHLGHSESAIRCFWEALRQYPYHARANYRLGQLLQRQGQEEEAAFFLRRADQINDFNALIARMAATGSSLSQMVQAAEMAERQERIWLAWGWYRLALVASPEQTALRSKLAELGERLEADPAQVDGLASLGRFSFESFPLPTWREAAGLSDDGPLSTGATSIALSNVAKEVGIDFAYVNGDDPSEPGLQIYQELGGGVAVLDYDQDGWPDVYLSQGSQWPPDPKQKQHLDRLFRNLGNGRFMDVTEQAGLGDAAYSQGATAGDFNNDGFPDLYVANIGANRLYLNLGDGTFRDVTDRAGIRGTLWTTSVAIMDVNSDGIPDIYDVNYLAGDEPFTARCVVDGKPRACNPSNFDGEQDQLWLGTGEGRFTNATESAGLIAPNGNGLGLVAADFDQSGRLSLMVANDWVANFYFKNQTPQLGAHPAFEEMALLSGLAFDHDGLAQACMGIAVDDADNDGLLDLWVSNFYNEPNTFYCQTGRDQFEDKTRDLGLREPTLRLLGFGTQFLDLQRDGFPDLIVANGHVDDYRYAGTPFQMRPQVFVNMAGTSYQEASATELGGYFQEEYLGRALARWDFNRDGLMDCVIMNLVQPVAVLRNETREVGHFVNFVLKGRQASRDAIGARVTVRAGGTVYTRQLTGGDGYHAANQRLLQFGLGEYNGPLQVRIRWLDGQEQVFESLSADRQWNILQGDPEAYPEQLVR